MTTPNFENFSLHNTIKSSIEKNGFDIGILDILYDEISEKHDIEYEDFIDEVNRIKDELSKQAEAAESIASKNNLLDSGDDMTTKEEEQDFEKTLVDSYKSEMLIVGKSTAFSSQELVKPKTYSLVERGLINKDFQAFDSSITEIERYVNQEMDIMKKILLPLITQDHFVNIPIDGKIVVFPTHVLAHDFLALRPDWHVKVQTQEVMSLTGDIKMYATCSIYNERINFSLEGVIVSDFVRKVRIKNGKKKIIYNEGYVVEKLTSRAIRNAVNKIIPQKVMNELKQQWQEIIKEKLEKKKEIINRSLPSPKPQTSKNKYDLEL